MMALGFVQRRAGLWMPCLVVLVGWFYYMAYWNYGFIMNDEGFLLDGVVRFLGGQLPLRDFYSYAPLRYFYYAGWFQFVGAHVMVERFSMMVFGVVVPLMMFLVAWRRLPLLLALIPTGMVMLAPGPWLKFIDTFIPILNLWLMLKFLEKPSSGRLFGCGIVLGASAMIRQDHALLLFVVYMILLWLFVSARDTRISWSNLAPSKEKFVRLGVLVPGVCLGTAPVIAVYAARGALPDLFYGLVTHVSTESTYGFTFFDPLFQIDLSHPIATVSTLFIYLSLGILLLFPIALWRGWRRTGQVDPTLIAIGLTAAAAYPLTFLHPVFTRLVTTAELCYLLGTFEGIWLVDRIRQRFQMQPQLRNMAVGLSIVFLMLIPLGFAGIALANNNIFIGSIATRLGRPLKWDFPNAPIYESIQNTEPIRQVADLIEKETMPGDPIFATADRGFYFLTGRTNPTKTYFWTTFLDENLSSRQDMLAELEKGKPKMLIRRVEEMNDPIQNPQWWADYLAQKYRVEYQNANYVVYSRIGN